MLALGERPTDDSSGRSCTAEKKFSINFNKAKTKFYLGLHYNGDYNCLFVYGEKIHKIKANYKNVDFPSQFCLASISEKHDGVESCELSFKGNVYNFSVYYDSFDKSKI